MTDPRGGTVVVPNPYHWDSGEDLSGRHLWIDISWNPATRDITAILVHRDWRCAYSTILIGLGTDGKPNSTERAFEVPVGDTQVPNNILNQLRAKGLATIDDVLQTQITAT
jgi:hypothetical protein